MNSATVINIK